MPKIHFWELYAPVNTDNTEVTDWNIVRPDWRGAKYPYSETVMWKYSAGRSVNGNPADIGKPTYYKGMNEPTACVVHIMVGYMTTAIRWARSGAFPKSWHYSIGRSHGDVAWHLLHSDGGYHAGISARQGRDYPPTWKMWRGNGRNVNTYTLGVEHEGFPGKQFSSEQLDSSYDLMLYLASTFRWPIDINHFPPHADIDMVNRVNDFNLPYLRDQYYEGLFAVAEEQSMAVREELESLREKVERLEQITYANGVNVTVTTSNRGVLQGFLGANNVGDPGTEMTLEGENALVYADRMGLSQFMGLQNLNAVVKRHLHQHNDGSADVEQILEDLQMGYTALKQQDGKQDAA